MRPRPRARAAPGRRRARPRARSRTSRTSPSRRTWTAAWTSPPSPPSPRTPSPPPTSPPARRAWSPGCGSPRPSSPWSARTSSRSSGTSRTATASRPARSCCRSPPAPATCSPPSAARSTCCAACPASRPPPRAWADALEGTKAQVRDTRKTTPGLRALEKYAVRCGGGVNHRMSLSDAALVKDNHVVAAGGVAAGLQGRTGGVPRTCRSRSRSTPCTSCARSLDAGADLILLDNFTPGETAEAVALVGGRAAAGVLGPAHPGQRPRVRARPASTTSRSAPSPTPRRSWTSASTCARRSRS